MIRLSILFGRTCKSKSVFSVVHMGLLRVVNDERGTQTIHIMSLVMPVDPVRAILLDGNDICKVSSNRDRALCDHGGAIHLGVLCLKEAVRMQTGGLAQLVEGIDDQRIVEGNIDRWWAGGQAPMGRKQQKKDTFQNHEQILSEAAAMTYMRTLHANNKLAYGNWPLMPMTCRS